MEKFFVTYALAIKLKELGFNEPCIAFYDNNKKFIYSPNNEKIYSIKTLAPTWEQAFDWLETKGIYVSFPLNKLKRYIDIWEKAKDTGTIISSRVYFSFLGYSNKYKLKNTALTKAISFLK